MEVTKEQWITWRALDVTKEFFQRLFDKREQLKEGLAEGNLNNTDIEIYIGQCQAYKDAVNYGLFEFETIDKELEDDNKGNRV